MLKRLAARLRSSDIDYRLLVPLLISTMLVQMATSLIRVTISYRAIELHFSFIWFGIIAAAFALFPICIAVSVGRFIDRGHDALTSWIGAGVFFIASVALASFASPAALLVATTVLGAGHLCLMASQQMLCVRASGPGGMERVFGNYMVAGAIGQGAGPYIVGWVGGAATVPPTQLLFMAGAVIAAVSLAVVLIVRPDPKPPHQSGVVEKVPLRALLRVPGLVSVIVTGIVIVSSSDIIVIYVPLLGAERKIDVAGIGLLLTLRAAASMVARLFYPRLVEVAGRFPLMIASTFASAATFVALAAPLPLVWMAVIMVVMGFLVGLATTLSITIVVDMTTVGARGTANSLRIMGNRLGQFVLPFSAGLAAAAAGISGLLLICATAIAASAAAMRWKRPANSS
jgi:MFS family permease